MFYTLLYKFAPNSLSVNIILMICTAIYAVLHYIIFNGIVKLPAFIMKYSYAFYGIVIIDLAVFLYLYKKELNESFAQIDAKSQQLDEIIQKNVSLNKSQLTDTDDDQSDQQIENNNMKHLTFNGNPAMMQQNMMMNPQLSNGMNPAMMQQLIQQQMMQQRMNQMNQQTNNGMNQVNNSNIIQQNNQQVNNGSNSVINQQNNQQNNQQIQKRQMIVQQKKEPEPEQNQEQDQESESIVIERKTNEQQPTKDTIINNQSDDETSETKNEINEDSDEIDGESINKN